MFVRLGKWRAEMQRKAQSKAQTLHHPQNQRRGEFHLNPVTPPANTHHPLTHTHSHTYTPPPHISHLHLLYLLYSFSTVEPSNTDRCALFYGILVFWQCASIRLSSIEAGNHNFPNWTPETFRFRLSGHACQLRHLGSTYRASQGKTMCFLIEILYISSSWILIVFY